MFVAILAKTPAKKKAKALLQGSITPSPCVQEAQQNLSQTQLISHHFKALNVRAWQLSIESISPFTLVIIYAG